MSSLIHISSLITYLDVYLCILHLFCSCRDTYKRNAQLSFLNLDLYEQNLVNVALPWWIYLATYLHHLQNLYIFLPRRKKLKHILKMKRAGPIKVFKKFPNFTSRLFVFLSKKGLFFFGINKHQLANTVLTTWVVY